MSKNSNNLYVTICKPFIHFYIIFSHSDALVKEAQDLFAQHRYEGVEKFLENMVPNDMLNPEIYRMLAEVSAKQNKVKESEQFYKLYNSIK
jgi:predicted Zn-dependent protease